MAHIEEIGYLAGAIDGEGSILLDKHKAKRWEGWQINARIAICNTEPAFIEKCKDILDKLGVRYSVYEERPTKPGAKKKFTIYICRQKALLKLLEAITPHLSGKKRHAELMMEWLKIQISRHNSMHLRDKKTGRIIGAAKLPYTKRQMEIYEDIRRLNHRGI